MQITHYIALGLILISNGLCVAQTGKTNDIIQIIYTSDAHYGITRPAFRGDSNVNAQIVNRAMIRQINTVPKLKFPADAGVKSGATVGFIDYIVEGGDITNRMEKSVQSSTKSWGQFYRDYATQLKLKGSEGRSARLMLMPGNHDISNAIGFRKPMKPEKDPSAMVGIYNFMLKPSIKLTKKTFDYSLHKVHYSIDVKGLHIVFVNLWPDSAERIWLKKDLQKISTVTPIIIFAHDQPESEAKHFSSPSSNRVTSQVSFENLSAEHFKDGDLDKTDVEQRGWTKFLKSHLNIKAYFHGNSNWNEFYQYRGPDNDVDLNVFRVDSPMKGDVSFHDERKLSFQLISIDTKNQLLTVRECLWNILPEKLNKEVVFGASKTISLSVAVN